MIKNRIIHFYKMHSGGNDFILIDNRTSKLPIEQMSSSFKKICSRCFGVGANNVILLDHASHHNDDYRLYFYNSDGSRVEMCANGARCIAWLAVKLKVAQPNHQFQTDVGSINVTVYPKQACVKILLTKPKDLKINLINYLNHDLHFVNTGVPHVVILTDSIESIDVKTLGCQIRNHPLFSPNGTNVDFAQVIDPNHLRIRTYERGVEQETYACGTGSAAAAIITHALGLTENDIELITQGKERLRIILEQDQVFLEGNVHLVYTGQFYLNL